MENAKERHDRELIELLNELRVALPGIQVLIVRVGNVLTITGLVALAVAIVSVVLLVLDYVVSRTAAFAAAGVVAVLIAVTWYGLGFVLRARA